MNTQARTTALEPVSIERVEYVKRSTLFGLISWHEELSREVIGTTLFITTSIEPGAVVLNGRQLYDLTLHDN